MNHTVHFHIDTFTHITTVRRQGQTFNMTRVVPSPAALRYLHRLCTADFSSTITRACIAGPSTRHHFQRPLQHQRLLYTSPQLAQTSPSPATEPSSSPPPPDDTPLATSLPDITSFYTLFPHTLPQGPPPASPFHIPLSPLKREFLQLQSRFHPDKYPTSTPAHQKALALSSFINNAYQTLADPLLRAQYLLQELYDIDVMSEDNSSFPTDQGTLMEVMEAQESVEEAQSQEEVDRLKAENRVRIDDTVARLGAAFERNNKDAAIQECVRLNYWRSLQQGLEDWEPGKEIRLIH